MRQAAAAVLILTLSSMPLCAQPLDARLPVCFGCHGENGQSQLPEVASLGAQPALYSLIQLVMFRDKLRVNEPMNEIVKGLSDDDLRKAADVIAKLPPPEPVADVSDPARMEKGRMLAETNRCNFCHQASFQGERNVPRLAGQREDYLIKAMRAYKDNSRHGYDAQMSEVLYPMQDADMVDIACFLARTK